MPDVVRHDEVDFVGQRGLEYHVVTRIPRQEGATPQWRHDGRVARQRVARTPATNPRSPSVSAATRGRQPYSARGCWCQ